MLFFFFPENATLSSPTLFFLAESCRSRAKVLQFLKGEEGADLYLLSLKSSTSSSARTSSATGSTVAESLPSHSTEGEGGARAGRGAVAVAASAREGGGDMSAEGTDVAMGHVDDDPPRGSEERETPPGHDRVVQVKTFVDSPAARGQGASSGATANRRRRGHGRSGSDESGLEDLFRRASLDEMKQPSFSSGELGELLAGRVPSPKQLEESERKQFHAKSA